MRRLKDPWASLVTRLQRLVDKAEDTVAPAAILIALQPFQQRTLAWMIQRETGEADESGPSFSTAFSYLVRMQHQSCVVLPLSSENQYFLVLTGWYLLQAPSIRSSRVS